MALRTVSVDSGTQAQVHARRNEMDRHWAAFADPLDILIRWEERAFVVYNLTNYDDPIVDRKFINGYIAVRIGDQHEQRTRSYISRYGRSTITLARVTCRSSSTVSDRVAERAQCKWVNGARVVERSEIRMEAFGKR